MTRVWLKSKSCELESRLEKFVAGCHSLVSALRLWGDIGSYGGKQREGRVNRCDRRGGRSVDISQPFMLTQTLMDKVDGERYWLVGRLMREELMRGWGFSSEPPRCLFQLPVQDASRRPDWPDRKSRHLGTVEGKRACDLHSPSAFPNLVSTASWLRGHFPVSQGSKGD